MSAVATAGGLPTRLGKYEILTPLAAGGMARIYIARTTGIGSFERHVVLKLITPERANDHTAVQMFLDEARLAASLNHQNVAQVFEVGEDAGIHYLAMEYVHGQDLRALLAKAGSQGTRVPLELALTVVAGAAAGLHHAHERRDGNGVPLGIVHRDVSPSNIMIGLDGSVKLLDFGIAKAAARSIETVSGIIKGKFAYMAPEQCRGRDVDRRSDVFSLGIILYEVTTQHRCFRADSDFDTMHRIVTGDVVRPTRLIHGYPPALEAIVMKALAVDANQRYQSAGQLLEALEAFAVSARMSLSTMALGRFMREMFGEVPEPWLVANRNDAAPTQPKESTISNTNGSTEGVAQRRHPTGTTSPVVNPGAAARAVLDLPAGANAGSAERAEREDPAEWNAKSYPKMPVQQEPVGAGRKSNANLPTVASPVVPATATPPAMPAATPAGAEAPTTTTPPIDPASSGAMPANAFPEQPSGSGRSHPSLAVNFKSPTDFENEVESIGSLRRRGPLWIGLGVIVIAIAIVIVISMGGKDEVQSQPSMAPEPPAPTNHDVETATQPVDAAPEPEHPVATAVDAGVVKPVKHDTQVTVAPKTVDASVDNPPVPPADDTIHLVIESEPSHANVLLAGVAIGKTPLDIEHARGTGDANLSIQHNGYQEMSFKVDLTNDVTKKVALKAVVHPIKVVRPPINKVRPPKGGNTGKTDKPKKDCQPPGQALPFDPRPVCKS